MKVAVIKTKQRVILVEYPDGDIPERVWIPREELKDDEVSKETIRRGVKYGLPWSELLSSGLFASDVSGRRKLESLLRLHGIWTLHDLTVNAQVAQGIVRTIIASVVAELISKAKSFCV